MPNGSREISLPEKFFFWRTKLGCYSNYRVMTQHSIELSPALVYHAVSLLCYKYSVFVTDVFPMENTESGYGLGLVDEVRFGDVVEFVKDESFTPTKILDKYEHVKFKFSDNKPLWKLIIINKKYALFFCDHVLFDGTSGKNFHIEFANIISQGIPPIAPQFFQGMMSPVFQKFEIDPEEYAVTPTPEDLIKYEGPLMSTAYKLVLALAPKPIADWIKYFSDGNKYAKILSYDTMSYKSCALIPEKASSSRIIHLEECKVNSLLKLTRQNDVKLTSLLIMIAHISMGQFIGDSGKDSRITVPVNIRFLIDKQKAYNMCNNFTDLFGPYVGCVNIDLPSVKKICSDNKVNWETVQYINNTIHEGLPTSAHDWGLLNFTSIKNYVDEKYNGYDKATFEISNLGMIPRNVPSIEHAWFDQACEIFSINAISTKKGANLVLRCCNEEWVDEYASMIVKVVDELIKP